jgi:uncharacterized membrane protein
VQFEVVWQGKRDRLTTFFRLILAIPHIVVLALAGIAEYVVTVIAWVAILITGRYPRALRRFSVWYFVYAMRVTAWLALLCDGFPPFGGSAPYRPVRVTLQQPGRQSRLTTLFRLILFIPAGIADYLLNTAATAMSILLWLVILVTGRSIQGLHAFIELSVRFRGRSYAYLGLLTDSYPSFSEGYAADEEPAAPELPEPEPTAPAA